MQHELSNTDAEQAVLGGLILDRSAFDEIEPALPPDAFSTTPHQLIYEGILGLIQAGIVPDVVTLAERLKTLDRLDVVGGSGCLETILDTVPDATHCKYYADIVRNKWRRRSLHTAARQIQESCVSEVGTCDLFEDSSKRLADVLDGQSTSPIVSISDGLEEMFDDLRSDKASTIATGFRDLDNLLDGGLIQAGLHIVAARPGMGKTAFALNAAANVARDGQRALIFSLEMTCGELTKRLAAGWSGVPLSAINLRQLTPEQNDCLAESANELSRLPIDIDDSSQSIQQILNRSKSQSRREQLDLIIVDYIGMIRPTDPKLIREQQVADVSRSLKRLAGDLNVPVIALSQLNRQLESRDDKRPRSSDLRESGSLEQDADSILMLHRPAAYSDAEEPREAELLVRKNRHGRTGTVSLTWHAATMLFRNAN